MSKQAFVYDVVPYPGTSDPDTHVRHLEGLATLSGMLPAPATECRVLELGCASGRNLIPQAMDLPKSTFVGVDLSSSQIAAARQTIEELDVANVEFHLTDIQQIDESWGPFDYILAAGVFSWVPPAVQDRILSLCHGLLAPHGVAVITYNVLPGWNFHNVVRDAMKLHVAEIADPRQQVQQSRALLDFLCGNTQEGSLVGRMYRDERAFLLHSPDAYIYHDYLVENNHPLYFQQFVQRAESAGLQYVTDANPGKSSGTFLAAGAQAALANTPFHARGQLMDFLRNESYRKSIVCRPETSVERDPDPSCFGSLRFSFREVPTVADFIVHDQSAATFKFRYGDVTTSSPLGKAVMRILMDTYPSTASVDELLARLPELLPDNMLSERVRETVLLAVKGNFTAGLLDVFVHPPQFCDDVPPRPRASPLAQFYLRHGATPINQRHVVVELDDFHQQVLLSLNGQRDRQAVLAEIQARIAAGELKTAKNGQPFAALSPLLLSQLVDRALDNLCLQSLLVEA